MATPPRMKPRNFPWPKTRRSQIILGLAVLLVFAVPLIFVLAPQKQDETPQKTVPVKRGNISRMVAATGRVVPNFEVEIKGKASGKIIHLPYDVSDVVREGDLLVQLDPIDESRQVSQASASLAGVESRMAQTRINLRVARMNLATDIARAKADLRAAEIRARDAKASEARLAELVKSRYISQEEYETGHSEAAQFQSALENARVRLRELQTQEVALKAQAQDLNIASAEAQGQRVALASSRQRLLETRIYAPISGVVTSRAGQIGQIVASGINNVSGGTAIMTLADISRIFVLASVDESDIGLIREGQPVSITADAFPGRVFEGTVIRIAPKGFEESNVVTFEVKIEVSGADKQLLKPEMTANVEILIDEAKNALTVPVEAISTQNGKSFVRVPDEKTGKPRRVAVVTGINNGTSVQIIRGLSAKDKVIVDGDGEVKSRWRRNGNEGGGRSNARGQRMMMRSMGGGRR